MATSTPTAVTTEVPSNIDVGLLLGKFNFADRSSIRTPIFVVNGIFVGLVLMVIILRLYARMGIKKKFELEDGLAVAATVVSLVCSIMFMYTTHWGLGTHIWNLYLPDVIPTLKAFLKLMIVNAILYSSALTLGKLSIIATYCRVFPVRWLRNTLYVIAFFVAGAGICTVLVITFTCRPVRAFYDFTIQDAKCINTIAYLYVAGSINMVTDLSLCLLPLPLIYNLTMPTGKKIALVVLLLVGLFAFTASTLRVLNLHELKEMDISFTSACPALWSVMEADIVIICASAPAIKPLLVNAWRKTFNMTTFRRSTYASNTRLSTGEPSSEHSMVSNQQQEQQQHQPKLPAFKSLGKHKEALQGNVDVIQLPHSSSSSSSSSSSPTATTEIRIPAHS